MRLSEAEDSYIWLHQYLSDQSMQSRGGSLDRSTPTPFWISILELIHPTGRCLPRDVTVQTKAPVNPFMGHFEMRERMKDKEAILLGQVKMRMTPSIGEDRGRDPVSACGPHTVGRHCELTNSKSPRAPPGHPFSQPYSPLSLLRDKE
jgi:hypothetical protein